MDRGTKDDFIAYIERIKSEGDAQFKRERERQTIEPGDELADVLRPLTDKEIASHRVCEFEGTIGHYGCGVCPHGLAYIECEPCFRARCEAPR